MGVCSECGFCGINGPRSRGIAFFRGGVLMSSCLVAWQVHGVHRHLPAVLPAGLDQRRHHRHRLPPLSLLHHRTQNYSQYQEETGGSSNHFWLDQRWIFIFFINESDPCIKRVISRSHKSHFLSSIEILIFLFCTMDHGRMKPLIEPLTLILQGGQNQNYSCTAQWSPILT